LKTDTGETVQGWTATSTGPPSTTGPPGPITLPTGQVLAPTATQNFTLNANLDAQQTTGTPGTFSAPMQVVDSLGNTHDLTVNFTQSATTPSTWNYATTVPSADLAAGGALTGGTGSISFSTSGLMVPPAGSTAPVPLAISGLADGAANMNVNWNQYDSAGAGTITNYAEASDLASSTADGNQAAQLTSVAIQTGGQVVATYSNGLTKVAAQLAMAAIENPESLQNVGNNNFAVSSLTATPAVGAAQTGGRGQILGSSVESSNVDMATEFTHLIVFQSGYQAASRIISTVNNMNQDLFSLIH
jgi:flagellar hook protein FlgE